MIGSNAQVDEEDLMADTKQERMSDAHDSIDIGVEAYNDLLGLVKEQPGKKARIQIAGYG